jgi:polyisoprenoid-binding protein YceI
MIRALALIAALTIPAASAADWTVNPAHSRLGYEVIIDGSKVEGAFGNWQAQIVFDPAALDAARATVTVDLATNTSGNGTRDEALAGPKWFDVPNTPKAVFETTAFRQTGADAYEADGLLTMRGTPVPITLPFALTIAGGNAHLTARLTLDRTLWGIGQPPYDVDTPVATKVDVVIDLAATGS